MKFQSKSQVKKDIFCVYSKLKYNLGIKSKEESYKVSKLYFYTSLRCVSFFFDEETFAEVKFLISRKAQTYCILWKIHERISEFKGFFMRFFQEILK